MAEESGSWAQYQKLVLKLLEQHDEKLEQAFSLLMDSKADRATLHQAINSLKEDLDIVKVIVKEGTFTASSINSKIEKFESGLQSIQNYHSRKDNEKSEITKYRRGIITTIIGSALVIIWAVIEHFFLK